MKKILIFTLLFILLSIPMLHSIGNAQSAQQGKLVVEMSKSKMLGPFLAYILPLPGILEGGEGHFPYF